MPHHLNSAGRLWLSLAKYNALHTPTLHSRLRLNILYLVPFFQSQERGHIIQPRDKERVAERLVSTIPESLGGNISRKSSIAVHIEQFDVNFTKMIFV